MEIIGLTKAVALTTLTFTLSATPTWSQTNQNSFTCPSTPYPGCVEEIPTPLGLTPEPGKYQKINLEIQSSQKMAKENSITGYDQFQVKSNKNQKIFPSNYKYITQSFLQEINNFVSKNPNKTQFETTSEHEARLSRLLNIFSVNLERKGININNTYNIEIGEKSFNTSYNADQELLTVKLTSFGRLELEDNRRSRRSKNRRGIDYLEEIESYNLDVLNSTEIISKFPSEGLSFSLKRSDAKQLLSNKQLGVIVVSEFVLPFVNTKQSTIDKLNIGRTQRIYGGNIVENFIESIAIAQEELAISYAQRYRSQGYTSYIVKEKEFNLKANVKEIVIYNKKTKLVKQRWITPLSSEAYFNRGVVYTRQQKWDLALADFNQAIKLNPNDALAYKNRGTIYYNQQKWDLALADFNQAIKLNPNYAGAYTNRGNVYHDQQKWDLAVADYNKAIAVDPNLAQAYYNRGNIYLKLGNINKAREDLQRAAQLYLTQGNTAYYEDAIEILNSL
ncbi:tetratricopeptide repeat protein [Anabaenopsis tanganyikae CS-531]|uniref:Tetratricopeptide repeat protein n=2 Tax=Anabaenopsis TaxID=110103 RepID=A0ABT6KGM5_9CYAN|nr:MULTISPECIES: tetratricopeptide repeat protein [Anabaenopsis]MDB9540271.1 tetratricopeptide repeat protein [Anabaenopsis arnoldii]MDH6092670.1 tetratricopeptide repeat protein [Anabaenopsis arnoldii]MDH6107013.1 tetratricopeptide repeat protein [Anabaenopsis tanganyikae CS-531]